MVPKLGPTGRLPKGLHAADWAEVEKRFGTSPKRKQLLDGLLKGCRELAKVGVKTLYLDGSFVTKKRNPGDFDCCYDLGGIAFDDLPAVFRDFDDDRKAQKATYGGEFFPAHFLAKQHPPEPYLTFFQHDQADRPKGIIILDLGTLP
jgi:hypothetical protein